MKGDVRTGYELLATCLFVLIVDSCIVDLESIVIVAARVLHVATAVQVVATPESHQRAATPCLGIRFFRLGDVADVRIGLRMHFTATDILPYTPLNPKPEP